MSTESDSLLENAAGLVAGPVGRWVVSVEPPSLRTVARVLGDAEQDLKGLADRGKSELTAEAVGHQGWRLRAALSSCADLWLEHVEGQARSAGLVGGGMRAGADSYDAVESAAAKMMTEVWDALRGWSEDAHGETA